MKGEKFAAGSVLLIALLVGGLLGSGAACADGPAASSSPAVEEEESADLENEPIIVVAGEEYYNNGETVFNNFGTVYNNSGLVYNNGGTVYNNFGTVYNNEGEVFNNSTGALVYNNGGTVHNNGGKVIDNGGETDELDPEDGENSVSFDEKYLELAAFDSDGEIKDSKVIMTDGNSLTVTPNVGLSITEATCTAGNIIINEDGAAVLSGVDRAGEITLKFKADMPIIQPEFGAYGDSTEIKMICGDDVKIYYTLDGSAPTEKSELYSGPFKLEDSAKLTAVGICDGAENSDIVSGSYIFPKVTPPKFDNAKKGYGSLEAKPIIVANTGLEKIRVSGVTLEGDNAERFTLSSESAAWIAPGQSNEKSWLVAPVNKLKPGTYTVTAVVTFDSGSEVRQDISFTVTK